MKRFSFLIYSFILVLVLAACGGGEEIEEQDVSMGTEEEASESEVEENS